jgi:cytochrome c peroxidase
VNWLVLTAAAVVLAPGYSKLDFPPPVPGTYELPSFWEAADADVLTSDGQDVRLHEMMGDMAVVMSFIYTSCSDVNGCPLATFVLSQLQEPIQADPVLLNRVRLITISFDPVHDKPSVMAAYGSSFRREKFDWRFLTSTSPRALAPLLEDYDQFIQPASNDPSNVISHVLRVYLIDEEKQVRNIYNTSFLHVDTMLSDLRTILGESGVGQIECESNGC